MAFAYRICCKFMAACLSCLVAIGSLSMGTLARAEPVQEYELKTAYLYNFAMFTQWPQDWAPENGAIMSICTIGVDHFGPTLDQLQGRQIREKRLSVRRDISLQEAPSCHILYIAASERDNMDKINEALHNTAVLTVSDNNEIPIKSIINMGIDKKRLVFDVDLAAAHQARLLMSSKLLHLARRVY